MADRSQQRAWQWWQPLFVSVGATLLSACAVGPAFKPPAAPDVRHYVAAGQPAPTAEAPVPGGAAQHFVERMDIPAQWWELFHSAALDDLMKQALAHNPTVDASQAALRQAMENLSAQRGSYYPSVQAGYSVARQKNAVGTLAPTLNGVDPAPIFNLYTGQVSVSYLFDVFGLNRRQVEAFRAQADTQKFQLEATYLTLTANVALAAIQQASLRAQLAALRDIARDAESALGILRRQYELGALAPLDVLAQDAILSGTQAAIVTLEKQLAQQDDLLAVLAGRYPGEAGVAAFDLDALELPQDLPLSLPSDLVRQRPDVRAAEAQLHVATAQVGVAVADMLPQVTIGAGAGGVATQAGQLFASGNTFWSVGASLSQVLFSGGALLHHKRAAEAALDQAGAQYRGTVLAALQNVADTLHALESDAEAVRALGRQVQSATDGLTIARRNLELGAISYVVFLNAEQTRQQAVVNLVQARANRFADTVALYQALGGGWWNHQQDTVAQRHDP